jgi:HD-GYP domain-containing protein (c-di-GMP phosphodiesterase class II)
MVEFAKILKKMRRAEDPKENKPVFEARRPPVAKKDVRPPRPRVEPAEPVDDEVKPIPLTEDEFQEEQEEKVVQREIRPLFSRPYQRTEDRRPSQEISLEPDVPDSSELPRREFITVAAHSEEAAGLYEKMLACAKRIFHKDVNFEEVDTKEIVSIVAEIAATVSSGDDKLIEMAVAYISPDETYYLFQHSVNVCLLSLEIGHGLNYDMGKLVELGIAAFLHDIGMTAYEDMTREPRKLTEREHDEIKKHVEMGNQILKRINHGIGEAVITAQYEIHERLDGSGYPVGKKSIHDYARIIALADGFESMIHPRSFRLRYSIMEVYKRIFDAKNKYDQNYIKVLVDRIGFFPTGTFVQLNTKEVGKVMRQNPKSPLRPAVKVLYSPDGVRLEDYEVKELNLLKFPTIHIKKCFLEENQRIEE